MVTRVPVPGAERMSMRAWCASAIQRAIARPSPVPYACRPAVLDGHVETDVPARGGELDGIVEDDQQQLADERPVSRDPGFLERPDLQGESLARRQRPDGVYRTGCEVVEIERLTRDGPLATVRAGEGQEIAHNAAHAGRLPLDRLERRRVLRRFPLLGEG